MKRTTRWLGFVTMAGALAMLGDDCQEDIVQDPTFRDWCGDSLCSWTLDSGKIQRVPTWNADDFGVSFEEPGTQISQSVAGDDAKCLLFTTTADIDPAAQMSLLVDFNRDGTIDSQQTLGATQWQRVQSEITAPATYDGITFHIRKNGTGAAVLAEMRIQSATDCTAPASVAPLLLGEGCSTDSQCSQGLVCGNTGLCAECSADMPCADETACEPQSVSFPAQCAGEMGQRKTGDGCILDHDCASGTCDGASVQSLAAVFGTLDAGDGGWVCPATAPACDLVPDGGSKDPCQCVFLGSGKCR